MSATTFTNVVFFELSYQHGGLIRNFIFMLIHRLFPVSIHSRKLCRQIADHHHGKEWILLPAGSSVSVLKKAFKLIPLVAVMVTVFYNKTFLQNNQPLLLSSPGLPVSILLMTTMAGTFSFRRSKIELSFFPIFISHLRSAARHQHPPMRFLQPASFFMKLIFRLDDSRGIRKDDL